MTTPPVPHDVTAILREIDRLLNLRDDQNRVIGNAKYGVYAFYDYDGEPIYVGQTRESLRTRIRRHLTNQRTDAVAMNVLDPLEVAEIEVWPLYLSPTDDIKGILSAAEYTVYNKVLTESALGAVLNEGDIPRRDTIALPVSFRQGIVPEDIFERLRHPDVRIARRASTIASLARVISQRAVSKGLRRTLLTQARRLERLASQRLEEVGGSYPVGEPEEDAGTPSAP